MIDFSKAKAIYVYPGYTDMRYGINGLYLQADQPEEETVHVFCGKGRNTIKIIAPMEGCIYLVQKKLSVGRFDWPVKGEITQVQIEEIRKLLDGNLMVKKIEEGGTIKPKKFA